MTRARYESHILDEHPDLLRDFTYPASEIQKAIETAIDVRPGAWGARLEYVGPDIVPDTLTSRFRLPLAKRNMHVIVQEEPDNRGHVVTAYTVVKRSR
jgi:hypothetical protein